jgi:hypothetical protein
MEQEELLRQQNALMRRVNEVKADLAAAPARSAAEAAELRDAVAALEQMEQRFAARERRRRDGEEEEEAQREVRDTLPATAREPSAAETPLFDLPSNPPVQPYRAPPRAAANTTGGGGGGAPAPPRHR